MNKTDNNDKKKVWFAKKKKKGAVLWGGKGGVCDKELEEDRRFPF